MEYAEYLERFEAHRRFAEVSRHAEVVEKRRRYPLLVLRTSGDPELLITSGFHGEEPAGPLTLLEHMESIVDLARSRGVGLRVYPCVNPSGFERGTRYNASGESPNNDFLRYQVSARVWKDVLAEGETFRQWRVHDGGPRETRALRADLERGPVPRAALDIHQDDHLGWSCCYAYVFGDRRPYLKMMKEASKHAAVATRARVDQGVHSDDHGFVELRDGSVSDYLERRGARYVVALETTTKTPPPAADAINLIWIRGMIELTASSR